MEGHGGGGCPVPGAARRAYGVMVFTVEGGAITAVTGFSKPELFPHFDLPDSLDTSTTPR